MESSKERRFAAKKRYLEAYFVANTITAVGKMIKTIGGISGFLLFIAITIAGASMGNTSDSAIVFGILGLIIGGIVGVVFYIWGILVAAHGENLKASLDHAVHTSPFLSDDEKAKTMTLPS